MKSFFLLTSLAACALAQRMHIQAPTPGQTVSGNGTVTVELEQDPSLGPMRQTSVLIAIASCYDVCDQPDQWSPGTIVYNGGFDPEWNTSAPEKGHYQDFQVQLPGLQPGPIVFQVAHQYQVGGAELQPVFDYATVLVNVV
ncbi:hypothetical protein PsYK624_150430 [Phanerochaete sordida]|uniref:Galactose-binding like protein n=1 Tax=Phanerochaete sordida TaxID=48140 RepID=A0A9P3GQ40_9APHY|nr:hypothetical protein PsYK624_150430 [Phanerochaete sordida]